MAKQQVSHAYRNLVIIMIVLLVLAAASWVGFFAVRQMRRDQIDERKAAIEAENEELIAQYNAAKAEADRKNKENEPAPAQRPQAKGEGWEIVDLTDFPVVNSQQKTATRQELLMGGLILVNRWHALPDDYGDILTNLTTVHTSENKIPTDGSSVRAFPVVISALTELLNAAKEQGYEYYIIQEAFRSAETQQEKWDKEAAAYADRLTGAPLEDKVMQSVNKPGTSEYQTGFSFRVDRYKQGDKEFMDNKFQNMEMSDWLLAHSWEYGIVFRFPVQGYPNGTVTDKSYVTGESKKLSIYRYVGKAHAEIMHNMNFCLEEYVDYLRKHPHIAVYEDGELKYEIVRTEDPYNNATVSVSVSRSASDYTVSTDNMGGVVTAMYY